MPYLLLNMENKHIITEDAKKINTCDENTQKFDFH